MRIAIIGCGFVADFYMKTLANYPNLELVAVMDKNVERAAQFSEHYSVPFYGSLEELLANATIELILNLTNPRSHFSVSKACLEAGKHVYSEKPLAMAMAEAEELVNLAERKGLYIASAPCTLLSETAQTLWKALRQDAVGKVRVVYAEMDDGMIHKMPYQKWESDSGTPWPYKDEFEIGCTLEHAGYCLTWLAAFFGPAESVTAFSSCLIPDKETDVSLDPPNTPDFSVACIKFTSGVVARLTCSIIAPVDHSLKIVGDKGILCTEDCWDFTSPVYLQRRMTIRRKTFISPWKERYPLVKVTQGRVKHKTKHGMDFCRGVAELADAIRQHRVCRLSPQFSLHVNELVLAIQNALENGQTYHVKSSFDPAEVLYGMSSPAQPQAAEKAPAFAGIISVG
ncbi:MAG: Gfo/Idh/MocA family oxidoreductase [Oscillatoriales cyanobacterium RM2_1_1]|nr:Gfo/Idh/MocA family oxidoreductase [Oscillatoriales cyanobacterium SM2_3_0]NJO46789.1 Gfo/Idh/MocA family oxidoreductase [Oscillatoriales cyanobacterium RM2_1_1]